MLGQHGCRQAGVQKGDPVFTSSVSQELVQPPYCDLISRALASRPHSNKRILACELLFNVCKCTSPETRCFVASQLPLLLWTEWVLDRQDPSLDEDLSAIEIALLAAYQQDVNIQTAVPSARVPDIKQPSIYHVVGCVARGARPNGPGSPSWMPWARPTWRAIPTATDRRTRSAPPPRCTRPGPSARSTSTRAASSSTASPASCTTTSPACR